MQDLLALRKKGLNLSIFYPSYKSSKHAPLTDSDRVFDSSLPVAKNIANCLQSLFQSSFSLETGIKIPDMLVHKKQKKRVIIHPTSGDEKKNWPLSRYLALAKVLKSQDFEPVFTFSLEEKKKFSFLENQEIKALFFSSLENFASVVYESGFFVGNDSFGGHLASCLQIPTVILSRSEKEIALWRPGWLLGEVLLPARWLFNFKGLRLKKHFWGYTIPVAHVLQKLQALSKN
jgi:ADP-heptose:LPS heptosyltransferase